MNDYHWADIAEAPRDGGWITVSAIVKWTGNPTSVRCRFIDGAWKDGAGTIWEPEYFVKEGKKP